MTESILPPKNAEQITAKHPSVSRIDDVFTFKMNRFVMINEREGLRWSNDLFDLSLNEWRVLALIKANEPVRAGDVADLMLMDKSQLSRLTKVLMNKQFIKSQPDAADARAVVLSVLPKGTALYKDMLVEVVRQNEKVLTPLTAAEVVQFSDMLDRLTEHSLSLLRAPVDPTE